jgi:hypothetical protein
MMEDTFGWHLDSKGMFSVKSAYKVHRVWEERRLSRGHGASSNSRAAPDGFWGRLWKLECPPKVKHFLWQLSHNTLAVRRILLKRGMELDMKCCMCNRLDEDGAPLLLKCKEVKKVWRELNMDGVRCKLAESTSAREMMIF